MYVQYFNQKLCNNIDVEYVTAECRPLVRYRMIIGSLIEYNNMHLKRNYIDKLYVFIFYSLV